MELQNFDDHNGLINFYRRNGLEVSRDLVRDDGAVFSVGFVENGTTVAAATLSCRLGVYILDYVSVDPDHRKKGLGKKLVEQIKTYAKSCNADKIYITAKNPLFFKKIGFRDGSPKGVDMNADCVGCPEYNNGCSKQPMYIDLK